MEMPPSRPPPSPRYFPIDLDLSEPSNHLFFRAQYVSLKENVSTALGVNKPLSVEEVCVKLGCTQNRRYALDLLDLYAKNTPNSHSINLVRYLAR
jgi:hypothetical protein